MIYPITDTDGRREIAPLFAGWEETLIYSCLQGIMGSLYRTESRNAAMAAIGDFLFYAGTPCEELVRFCPNPDKGSFIIVPGSNAWLPLIEQCHRAHCSKISRYAIRKDTKFDPAHLNALKNALPNGYTIKQLDEAVYQFCQENEWCRDWVSQFPTYQDYRQRGIGIVICKDGLPVSGASSYTVYDRGIEIEIQTLDAHRRKGLAAAAAAALILNCLDQGIYPSWDAANLWSVALARKLGYELDHEYLAYYVNRRV